MNPQRLTVFLDGICHLCSFEAKFLKKYGKPGAFNFIDISDPKFSAEEHHLNYEQVNDSIHVITYDGSLKKGIDAMIEMWSLVPRLMWLAILSKLPIFHQIFKIGYWIFKKIRRKLPKRSSSVVCEL